MKQDDDCIDGDEDKPYLCWPYSQVSDLKLICGRKREKGIDHVGTKKRQDEEKHELVLVLDQQGIFM